MDEEDLLDLAPAVLIATAHIAAGLGVKERDMTFGELAGEMATLSKILESPTTLLQEQRFRRRIYKLLSGIEKACMWTRTDRPSSFRFLRQLVETSDFQQHSEINRQVEECFAAYTAEGKLPKLIDFVRGFGSHPSDSVKPLNTTIGPAFQRPLKPGQGKSHRQHASQRLYKVLHKYSRCTCVSTTSNVSAQNEIRHLSRLRLRPPITGRDGDQLYYDILFSSRPANVSEEIDWQEARFRYTKENRTKRVKFSAEETVVNLSDSRSTFIREGEFCHYLKTQSGSKLCLSINGERLSLLEEALLIEHKLSSAPSMSLSTSLEFHHLSKKMKAILAYIVARSVWEFYDSDWMSRQWKAEDIHFMQEESAEHGSQPSLFVNRPYLSVQIDSSTSGGLERSTIVGQIHRYPRILSLGIMLIEIGTGLTAAQLNFLVKLDPWKKFDFRSYWDAVRCCINDPRLLTGNGSIFEYQSPTDVEERRHMIFENVVMPLEDLLEGTGWIHDLGEVGPMKPKSIASHPPQISLPTEIPAQLWSQNVSSKASERGKFEIAFICALPLEADAVISLFDKHPGTEDKSYGKSQGDANAYTTGKVGGDNVVVVHMPEMGKTTAAFVAPGLKTSFPNIKLALVVGICGGVPYDTKQRDIHLGDVVISQSLIRYDYGRQYPKSFEPRDCQEGVSGRTRPEIGSLLAKFATQRHRKQLQTITYSYLRGLQQNMAAISYPGADVDTLFHSSFTHQHHDARLCQICQANTVDICSEATGSSCEKLKCIELGHRHIRRRRSDNGSYVRAVTGENSFPPVIHIGSMASGDTVMKSGTHRDEIAKRHGIIAFEMEAAGIWNHFPSLVIKGICDYADSHKDKRWQSYAAATAAAAAKAFLKEWSADRRKDEC